MKIIANDLIHVRYVEIPATEVDEIKYYIQKLKDYYDNHNSIDSTEEDRVLDNVIDILKELVRDL